VVKLLSPAVREEFGLRRIKGSRDERRSERKPDHAARLGPPGERARGWRVGHQGRDEMYYEERIDGVWQRIRISGEMLMGRAHHVIYFASPPAWAQYPEWARHRRDEIIARIKSEFRPPDYEYQGDGDSRSMPPTAAVLEPVVPPSITPPPARSLPATPGQMRALAIATVIMLGIAGGAGWLVARGVATGETWFPSKRASQRRIVVRTAEPAMFWTSMGVYATLGAGALGLGAWGSREGLRLRRRK